MRLIGDHIRVLRVRLVGGHFSVTEESVRPNRNHVAKALHAEYGDVESGTLQADFPGHAIYILDQDKPQNARKISRTRPWKLGDFGHEIKGDAIICGMVQSTPTGTPLKASLVEERLRL